MPWSDPLGVSFEEIPLECKNFICSCYKSLKDFLQMLYNSIVADIINRTQKCNVSPREMVEAANKVANQICILLL